MSTIPEFATKLKYITVSGAVSVERVSKLESIDGSYGIRIFVLLGPTGSGKSTFIESLAPNTTLGLSSNKLEGFTQSVNIYRIVNIQSKGGSPIYIVDIPGFADRKISSMGIVSMLRKVIQTNNNPWFRILYFTPIHNPRFPRSQRRVLQTFEALTGPGSAASITIVSTMWDLVWGESALRRAESNFSQLQDKIWKEYISSGSSMVRFQNTQASALTILDAAFNPGFTEDYPLRESISQPLRQTPFASDLYNDLQIQIQGLQLQQTNIQLDLQDAREQSDEQLIATLIPQLEETQGLLAKFEKELQEFGPAPSPPPSSTPKKGLFGRAIDSVKRLEKKLHRNRDN